jgi:hypothetical protein
MNLSSTNTKDVRGITSNLDLSLKCLNIAYLADSSKVWWHIAYYIL